MTGGMERGELAWPVEATVLFSNSGICEINLQGILSELEKQSENKEVIQFDEIEKALVKNSEMLSYLKNIIYQKFG